MSFLERFKISNRSERKKISIPISTLSSNEIYALLDIVESDEEEEIENLMNDLDTEFVEEEEDPASVELLNKVM